jgi:hypothetical protein
MYIWLVLIVFVDMEVVVLLFSGCLTGLECFLCTSHHRKHVLHSCSSLFFSSGLALESMITILTPKYIPFFMILWIIGTLVYLLIYPNVTNSALSSTTSCIANVSVCIFPIDILPGIFHYGYAAPFYNLSHSIRSIAFSTRDTSECIPPLIQSNITN